MIELYIQVGCWSFAFGAVAGAALVTSQRNRESAFVLFRLNALLQLIRHLDTIRQEEARK